ncbi:hypothetical protein B0T17DRAFT_612570 [Bombardia bombarda]|uniref:Glutathione S-transferase n=1 Tax=Bombardia bombarda TaxID=252184 RepID=A0AA40CFS8_9PEZI|nr:hypothetical protein B0T17DRAFT_612570 [Bombardia bombarda]
MVYHLYITSKNYSSWSMRPWVLMRELSIPFHEEMAELISGIGHQPHWKAFSPTGCESLAIVEYLAENHPDKAIYPLLASSPTASAEAQRKARAARAWARSATAEMHAGFAAVRDEMGMNVGLRIQLEELDEDNKPVISAALARDLARLDELWSEGLAKFGGPFLAGDKFGAVDAFFAPVVLRLQTYAVKEWVEAALGETGREVLHDEDSVRGRRVLEDLRAVAAAAVDV